MENKQYINRKEKPLTILSLGWNNYFDGLDLLDIIGIIIWGQKGVIYFSLNR